MKNKQSVNELALELLSKGHPVTPEDLAAHVGHGPYAAKFVCLLRKEGHAIKTIREGRQVKHYQYCGTATAPPQTEDAKPSIVAEIPEVVKSVQPKEIFVEPTFDDVDVSDIQREYASMR